MNDLRRSSSIGRLFVAGVLLVSACRGAEDSGPPPRTDAAESAVAPSEPAAGESPEPAAGGAPEPAAGESPESEAEGVDLARRLRGALTEPGDAQSGLRSSAAVHRFYEDRDFRPAWTRRGRPTEPAMEALEVLAQIDAHGLDPAQYGVPALSEAAGSPDAAIDALAFELGLTDAWLTAGAHLLRGRVDPLTIHPEWSVSARTTDLVSALQSALTGGSPAEALSSLAPSHPEYARLQDALADLREHQRVGEWPRVRGPLPLVKGSTGPTVAALRARLARTDELADGSGDVFDADLAAAVRHFQARHGLEPTGRVDEHTQRALDVSIGDRIGQIIATLERWRWLPDELGERHVRVNIAAFDVVLVDGQTHTLSMRAVVGKRYRKTPVFSSEIVQITLNPRWTVPPKLAVRDLLPEIKRDPEVIARKRIRVFEARSGAEVDASRVPWSTLSARRFPYILKQEPGPENALGRFRFGMPNDYDVYLHDTAKRHLFAEDRRTYSSGCVRLQKARDLAVALLAGHPKWSAGKIDSVIAAGRELTIQLPRPVPVHILYWTAFVDGEGHLQLRDDIYGRDAALLRALAEGTEGKRRRAPLTTPPSGGGARPADGESPP